MSPFAIFRCDARPEIGGGHFFRCLTVARHFRQNGFDIIFLLDGAPDFARDLVKEWAVLIDLSNVHAQKLYLPQRNGYEAWLRLSEQEDADTCKRYLESLNVTHGILIVDHYGISHTWEKEFSNFTTVAIDDLANRRHNTDFLIDQNPYLNTTARYQHFVNPETKLLLGPDFTIVRSDCVKLRPCEPRTTLKTIFVCFGTADPTGETEKILKAVESNIHNNWRWEVVIGPLSKASTYGTATSDKSIAIYTNPSNIAEIMARSDFAFGAAGTMCYERGTLGLPMAVTTVADNQHQIAIDMAASGLAIHLGDGRETTFETYKAFIGCEMSNLDLAKISSRLLEKFDGRGVERIFSECVRKLHKN